MRFLAILLVLLAAGIPALGQPSFRDTTLRLEGKKYRSQLVASLSLVPSDPDLLLIGSVVGRVALVRVKRSGPLYSVTEELDEITLEPGRSVLGISSDPFDPTTFFLSTSILKWRDQGLDEDGWQNGRVERLIFDPKKLAIELDAEPAVIGLPVGLGSQGLGGTVVDPFTGRLLVAVSTFTNGGAPSDEEGNLPDSVLSSSVLEVDIRRGGTLSLEWSSSDSETATVLKSPIESGIRLYAEGLRSPYQPALSRFNRVFVVDGGANKMDGPRSISCTKSRPFNKSIPDKLIRLRRGEYYGHPNRQRTNQCRFISPLLKPDVAQLRFPNYTPPLFTNAKAVKKGTIGSGTVGVAFYDSNIFPGFRGTLIGADADNIESSENDERLPPGLSAYRLKKKDVVRIGDTPGVSLAVNIHGDIFAAQPQNGTIGVAVPRVGPKRRKVEGIRNIFPSRGLPGSIVFIVGVGLPSRLAVQIGGETCTKPRRLDGEAEIIQCVVPAFESYPRAPQAVSVGKLSLRTAFTVLDPDLAQPSIAGELLEPEISPDESMGPESSETGSLEELEIEPQMPLLP